MNEDKVSILYLDDEEHNLHSFRATFRRHFNIYTTGSAREALRLLRENDIPIVITDQRMPEMMGVQFLEAIIPEFPDTIRMILTGFSDVEAIIQAINTGRVYRYISKPWDEQELLMTLNAARDVVQLQRMNKQLVDQLQFRVQEGERIIKLFQKYVPEHVVGEVLTRSSLDELLLHGESRIVTVLMSDIRNFTELAGRLDPRDVVKLLNDYFACMTDCVKRHNGSVNKFIGDGLMALFGAPVSYLENQENAVLCAIEMVEQLKALNDRYADEIGTRLEIGIGINTGEVVVGNIGSEERVEYTAIGDTVNLAARIEQLTKQRPNSIFISESTLRAVRDLVQVQERGEFAVKGKAEKIPVFEVMARK